MAPSSITLQTLLEQADKVAKTKQDPPAKIRGDWQETGTVYAVVDRTEFEPWRQACLDYLSSTYGEDSDEWLGFRDICRFPNYLEFLEGQKFLKALDN